MQGNKLKINLTLHFIVFIWGFTAILGALISLKAMPLVFFRMWLAVFFIVIYFLWTKKSFKITKKAIFDLGISGGVLALHWILFYKAIKVSNVSVTMVTLSTGTFFASLLEPIFYKRKLKIIEIIFGLIVILGLYIVNFQGQTQSEDIIKTDYSLGIIYALIAAFLSALLAVINGKLVKKYDSTHISLYQLFLGVSVITIVMIFTNQFSVEMLNLSMSEWFYMFILSGVCTAWTFIESVNIMKYITPFTMMLTINLEPIYAIILALLIFKDQEKMNAEFYLGAFIILSVVLLNEAIKRRK